MELFSSMLIGWMAPAGQTEAHLLHSERQYPSSKDISGCIRCSKLVEGRNTWFGHAEMQSWQAVQWLVKCLTLIEPAGFGERLRTGIFLSSITAKPPSTFFAFASMAAPATKRALVAMKFLLELSTLSLFVFSCFCKRGRFTYWIAP